ncbi:MAG: alpha/beta hydrolase [Pseudomonadota bacterium]
MAQIRANGVSLEVEDHGAAGDPPLLLIMGLGFQLAHWPDTFIDGLVARGLRVVAFDNRDIGLSQKFDNAPIPNPMELLAMNRGERAAACAYTLHDMAADSAGLIDALGLGKTHLLGLSMGGMIAQITAAKHGEKVASLTSIMSTTGDPKLPQATPAAGAALMSFPPAQDRETVVRHAMGLVRTIGSPGYPREDDELFAYLARAYDRSYYVQGAMRQAAGIIATGNFRSLSETIDTPSLVIHGREDPLVPVAAGEDTAAAIQGARLEIIDGMGHDLPPALVPQIVDLVADHVLANA